jgi:hypothetical protein
MNVDEQIKKWPKEWSYDRQSEAFGKRLFDEMMPFIQSILDHGYTKRTVERHLEYLFLLGGEIVSMAAIDEEYDRNAGEVLLENIDDEGGPLCRHLHTEERERQYDGTCRKLYRFIEAHNE